MDKKRLKIALAVLNAVRSTFPETNEFVDTTLKKKVKKRWLQTRQFFFLLNLQIKISFDKHFCFRFATIVTIFLFIDVQRCGRQ